LLNTGGEVSLLTQGNCERLLSRPSLNIAMLQYIEKARRADGDDVFPQ